MIYHITTRQSWEDALQQEGYATPSLETEGFTHCSTAEQVVWVANKFYKHLSDLVLLCIDESLVKPPIKWENASHPDGGTHTLPQEAPFPHIYGVLNLDSVVEVRLFAKNPDGSFTFDA